MTDVKNLEIEKGRNFKAIFTFTDINKVPIPLTGMTFKSECRTTSDYKSTLIFSFTCVVEDVANGQVSIAVLAAGTKALAASKGDYDITEVTTAKTFVRGEISFVPSTTELT